MKNNNNNKPLGFGEYCPRINPVPEGAERLQFKRNGRNMHKGVDCHWFQWDGGKIVLKGHSPNRILSPVDVYTFEIDGCKIYSEFSKEETIEKLG